MRTVRFSGRLLEEGCLPGGGVSQHALRQTPPVDRITDRCKNITFVADGNNLTSFKL